MKVEGTNSSLSLWDYGSMSIVGSGVGFCLGKGLLFAAKFAYENCPPHLAEKTVTFIAEHVEWIPIVFATIGGAVALKRLGQHTPTNVQSVVDKEEKIRNSSEMPSSAKANVLGKEAWRAWGIEILDKVPEPQNDAGDNENYIDIYFPEKIRCEGKEIKLSNLSFLILAMISGKSTKIIFGGDDRKGFMKCLEEKGITPGWKRMSKKATGSYVLTDSDAVVSRNETKKKLGHEVPRALEAAVLALLVEAKTGTYIGPVGCTEMWEEKSGNRGDPYNRWPVFVKFDKNNALEVFAYTTLGRDYGGDKGFNSMKSFS